MITQRYQQIRGHYLESDHESGECKAMQGIPEMHDIPTMRDVSAFTMVRNLIIGSLRLYSKINLDVISFTRAFTNSCPHVIYA